ncbi:hypothetical protein [Gordonia effusa]|nr:hypothetical protein [Gordonia effusa]
MLTATSIFEADIADWVEQRLDVTDRDEREEYPVTLREDLVGEAVDPS